MASSSTSLINTLSTIQRQIAPYIYSIELTFGIINCSLSILLFSRRQFQTITCCKYFLVASVAMLFNLIFGLGTNLYMINYGTFSATSPVFCKLRNYLFQCSAMMYRWYIVAACLDRYVLSSDSVRLRNFAKMHIARRVITINAVLCILLPIHNLIFFSVKEGICVMYSMATQYYHTVFTLLTGCILPVLIMIISAVLTHRNLVLKRRRRQFIITQQKEAKNDVEDIQRKRDRQVLITLISQVIVFVITMTPRIISYFIIAVTISMTDESNELLAITRSFSFMIEPIVNLFPILSFYLYIMTSGMFRTELMIMLRAVWRYRWFNNRNRIGPT